MVLNSIENLQEINHVELLKRFKKAFGKYTIDEFFASKDVQLMLEINALEEEILRRISRRKLYGMVGKKPLTKGDIINKLIKAINQEIDYWLLEENKTKREWECGVIVYNKMEKRFTTLRDEIIETILLLPEVKKEKEY
jgi:hypothetical protein